jgi:hypothetical protein
MFYLSKTIFGYRFYKILVIEQTTEVKAVSIGAPSVKEIGVPHSVHLGRFVAHLTSEVYRVPVLQQV